MPRRKTSTEEREERPSRSQLKRDSSALQDLGERLARLPVRELRFLGLSEELLGAVEELGRTGNREGRRRQIQYIGRLMRDEEDVGRLRLACEIYAEGRLPSSVPGLFARREPGGGEPAGA